MSVDEEANELLTRNALVLLVAMLLDQQAMTAVAKAG
jgi:predicted XRE-type DNA-binding protein